VSARREAAAAPAVVIATTNAGKQREIRAILAGVPVVLRGLDEFPPVDFPEEGDDYAANAIAKAQAVARATGCAALADDSGLEVDGLGGAPGPRSARFGGPGLDDPMRTAALLEALAACEGADRNARFVCVAAFVGADGTVTTARGECEGRILSAPRGGRGFGYDPVFGVAAETSMAELPESEKNAISHRANALRALIPALMPPDADARR
jgi:XTP/dITP diphosphohydrolase